MPAALERAARSYEPKPWARAHEGVLVSRIEVGDLFPEFVAATTEGGAVAIPRDLAGAPAVLLFYRGRW